MIDVLTLFVCELPNPACILARPIFTNLCYSVCSFLVCNLTKVVQLLNPEMHSVCFCTM